MQPILHATCQPNSEPPQGPDADVTLTTAASQVLPVSTSKVEVSVHAVNNGSDRLLCWTPTKARGSELVSKALPSDNKPPHGLDSLEQGTRLAVAVLVA